MRPYFRLSKLGLELEAAGKRFKREPPFGTWMLDYRDALGRRVRKASKARTEAEAVRETLEIEEREEAIRTGDEVPSAFKVATWETVRDAYLEAHSHLSSQAPMRSQFKQWFDPHFKKRAVSGITVADCDALLGKARRAGQSDASIRQLHIRGRLVFKFAEQRLGAIRSNPWAKIPRPKLAQKKALFLKREEIEAILAGAGEFRVLVLVAVFTGLRKGELAALRWTDIDFSAGRHGVIYARRSWTRDTTKGKRERAIPIHPALREELLVEYRRRGADGDLLFPAPRRGGVRHDSWHLAKLLRSIASRSGVTLPVGFTWHGLRATFITHVVRKSGDVTAAQRLAGHSTPTITERVYLGEDLEQLEDALGQVEVDTSRRHKSVTSPDSRAGLKVVTNKKG